MDRAQSGDMCWRTLSLNPWQGEAGLLASEFAHLRVVKGFEGQMPLGAVSMEKSENGAETFT